MSIAEEIERLEALRAAGTLSQAEFEAAKERALSGEAPAPRRSESSGVTRALWALVIVVIVGGAAAALLLDQASESLRLIAGAAVVGAGALGGILGVMEDLSFVAVGGLGLGALAIGAIVFTGAAPVLLLAVLAVLAVGAVISWFGGIV